MFDKKIDDRENEAESESQELEKNTELDEITEMDDTEGDANNAINKTTSTEKECLDSEDFVSKKRNVCSESEPIPEKAVKKHFCSQSSENTGDATMIVELIKESNDRIEKKLDASEQKIIESIKNSYRNDPVNTYQSKVNQTEKNDEIFRRDLASCKDLDSLVICLHENQFTYDEESGIISCTICTSEEAIRRNVNENNTGHFKVNIDKYILEKFTNPNQQPKTVSHLKSHIAEHLFGAQGREKNAFHQKLLERIETEHLAESKRQARFYTAGMNLFRIRYNEIMQGNSYNSFESDILTAKLNKCEVGDVNHSRMFARALTKDIAAIKDIDLKQALSRKLDCTNQRPPVGMVMDTMTPNKRTGQIHAIIVPVPSNPLSDVMLASVMLEVPPVTHHDAAGLGAMAKKVLIGAGVRDSQLEGVGWDGQYVLLGVMKKLIELLDIPGMDTDTKRKWNITHMWEPAHNIELATKDIREMTTVFDWFVEHISIVNGIIQTLNIGKGLEQCLTAAEEQNRRLYRLTHLSTTRFSAYFERSLSNFEKDFPVIVQALQTRSIESGEKDAREHGSNSLKKILTKTFIMVNLGLIDIYRLLGSYSCLLQTIEQFPWTVEQRLRELIQCFRDMSTMKLNSAEEDDEVTDVSAGIDQKRWPRFFQQVDSVLTEQYHGLSTELAVERRRGRSAADMGSNDILLTVENRLTSLCKNLADRIENRTIKNEKYPIADIFQLIASCFELQDLLQTRVDSVENYGVVELKKLLKQACCSQEITTNVLNCTVRNLQIKIGGTVGLSRKSHAQKCGAILLRNSSVFFRM
jgi:hypothetical protein